MDLSGAWIEPLVQMHESHEALNHLAKLGTAALCEFRDRACQADGREIVARAIAATGQPWERDLKFDAPAAAIDRALNEFARLCLVQGMAGFDRFTELLVEEICRSGSNRLPATELSHSHQDPLVCDSMCCRQQAHKFCRKFTIGKRVEALMRVLGTNDADATSLLPVFHFMRQIRNCLAHDVGIADQELEAEARSVELAAGWKTLAATTRSGTIPRIPCIVAGEPIPLLPAHAVLSGIVCHRIANRLNEATIMRIGVPGMLHMACYHSLWSRRAELPQRGKYIGSPIAYVLQHRYRVQASAVLVKAELERLGFLQAVTLRRRKLYDEQGFLMC